MAWYKCFSHGGGTPTPSEWDIELYDLDFSSSDPYDTIQIGGTGLVVEFSLDTNAEAYDNDNNFGFITLLDAGQEPQNCVRVVQFCMNKYEMKVFIRGRIYFGNPNASDEQHIAIGEVSGASRVFEGDYRNKDLRVNFDDQGNFTLSTKNEHGFWIPICNTYARGVPIAWEEGHEGDWEYITDYYPASAFNTFIIGKWYGGVAWHQFDGHANYIKIKQTL